MGFNRRLFLGIAAAAAMSLGMAAPDAMAAVHNLPKFEFAMERRRPRPALYKSRSSRGKRNPPQKRPKHNCKRAVPRAVRKARAAKRVSRRRARHNAR